MNKAFIFDMDGVIVDSENAWRKYGNGFLANLFGKEISDKIGDTIGLTVNTVYDKAISFGATINKDDYLKAYDKQSAYNYSKANITEGVDPLVAKLISLNFKLGLVSSSRKNWIEHVLPRLSFRNKLEEIISINDSPDIKPKPSPDGYLKAIKRLGASPKTTIILEDSNSGIAAAKASGAFTIAFTQNLVKGYKQIEANAKAGSMQEVIKIIHNFSPLDNR